MTSVIRCINFARTPGISMELARNFLGPVLVTAANETTGGPDMATREFWTPKVWEGGG